jgi:hypothetical protein
MMRETRVHSVFGRFFPGARWEVLSLPAKGAARANHGAHVCVCRLYSVWVVRQEPLAKTSDQERVWSVQRFSSSFALWSPSLHPLPQLPSLPSLSPSSPAAALSSHTPTPPRLAHKRREALCISPHAVCSSHARDW